jgi:hypothetical protein
MCFLILYEMVIGICFFINESKLRVKYIMKKKTQLVRVFNYMKLCCIYLYFVLCNSGSWQLPICIFLGRWGVLKQGSYIDFPWCLRSLLKNRRCLIMYSSNTILSSFIKGTAKTLVCSIGLHWLSVSEACNWY